MSHDLVEQGNLIAWVMQRGEDWIRTLIFYTDEMKTTRRNLTGYTATAQVRRSPDSTEVLLTLTTAINGTQGEVVLSCPHSQSDITLWQNGVMDMKLVAPGGTVEYLPALTFSVEPTVTR